MLRRFTGWRCGRNNPGRRRGRVVLIHSAGVLLDGEVARRFFGRAFEGDPPAYSTDDLAAQRLRELIEARGIIRCTLESWEGSWYCVWWSVREGQPQERIASGSGESRALAFCRASLNLPSWVPLIERARPSEPRACQSCGSQERMRGRARAVRLCNVCSWKAAKTIPDRRTG